MRGKGDNKDGFMSRLSLKFSTIYLTKERLMKKYVCGPCGYVYDPAIGDPDNGVAAGTAFEDLPEDWVCPECGVGKEYFEPEE